MARILVVDDDPAMREAMTLSLKRDGHDVDGHADAREALERFAAAPPQIVVTDYKMPGMDGLEFVDEIRGLSQEVPVIMVTAHGTKETALDALRLRVFEFLEKPFAMEQLQNIVRRAFEHRDRLLTNENEYLRVRVEQSPRHEMVCGRSPVMAATAAMIRQVAASDSTILITGESGVGKELAAAMIHGESPRRDKPFLCVNCAALSAGLLESELFGHEKGAFTGADRIRKGRFELAHQGTILLDEVSEIDPNLQAKLLRVLQERAFERIGSSRTQRVDVRVIATTNRDLKKAVAAGTFRADLYYRLNVVPIEIPPLRNRREDIPLLIDYYRKEHNIAAPFSRRFMEALNAYAWPGNVRELANIMERIAVLSRNAGEGGQIPESVCIGWLEGPTPGAEGGIEGLAGMTIDEIERKLIRLNLERCGGNQEKTAAVLGISSRTLREKLKRMVTEVPSTKGDDCSG